MNSYEQKQAERKARFQQMASGAAMQAVATYKAARQRGDAIPFGQPILVGHHSEGRDRRYRAGIFRMYGKAFALDDKAKHYAKKAESVGKGGISSDDPDALEKLRAELAGVQRSQELMKAANKAIRGQKTPEALAAALVALGFSAEQAAKLVTPDFVGRIGFAAYALQNNNSNARRIEQRIQELETRRNREDKEEAGEGYSYREDVEENRVMFVFPGKPEKEIIATLKAQAFKWSPSRGAWVRQLNNAGIYAASRVRATLDVQAQQAAAE